MVERLIIEDFKQFGGKHCWTTSLKNVFDYHGLHLSEEMFFGLGGGLSFIYWYMKFMPAPFVGGRYGKGTEPLVNTCQRIGAEAAVIETSSAEKGYEELKKLIRQGEPVFIFVDMAYLPYMALPEVAHFGGHTVVVYGLDEEKDTVYISDRAANPVTVSIGDLKKARSSKFPPFAPKNKLLNIKYPSKVGNLEKGIKEAIRESCTNMLKPPIKNIGLAGIQKWADLVTKWPQHFKGIHLFECLFNTFLYIEISGTGGRFFRPMYAQFLKEASSILNKPALNEAAEIFTESGKAWSEIAVSALPDSWPTLKRIRELSVKKNRIFEEQRSGALEEMKKINIEVNDYLITKKVVEELDKESIAPLLGNLQQKILECYEVEEKAFRKLNNVIGG